MHNVNALPNFILLQEAWHSNADALTETNVAVKYIKSENMNRKLKFFHEMRVLTMAVYGCVGMSRIRIKSNVSLFAYQTQVNVIFVIRVANPTITNHTIRFIYMYFAPYNDALLMMFVLVFVPFHARLCK